MRDKLHIEVKRRNGEIVKGTIERRYVDSDGCLTLVVKRDLARYPVHIRLNRLVMTTTEEEKWMSESLTVSRDGSDSKTFNVYSSRETEEGWKKILRSFMLHEAVLERAIYQETRCTTHTHHQ